MNAVLRERYEDQMMANETVEAHIAFLHAGLDEVKQDVRKLAADSTTIQMVLRDKIDQSHAALSAGQAALRDKIDATGKELHSKIDTVNRDLGQRIDTVSKHLGERIDTVNKDLGERIDTVNKNLGQKIDTLSTAFAELRGLHKTVLWVCGGVVTVATVSVSVGKALGWI